MSGMAYMCIAGSCALSHNGFWSEIQTLATPRWMRWAIIPVGRAIGICSDAAPERGTC